MFLKSIRLFFISILLSISFIFSDITQQNIITIIGTTNVHGEIDPCG